METTKADAYKYLGDFVSNGWEALYKKRSEKAQGYSATCLAMCTELSLGIKMFDIAKLLYNSIFVNGTLVNMETWPHCTEKRITTLERIEQHFMRKLLKAHSKTPLEALYLELGIVPLRFNLMKRRVLYLQDILNRPDEELTKKILIAQKQQPMKGDFYAQVRDNMEELGINDDLLLESKIKLREELNLKIKKRAFEYLLDKAKNHSKVNTKLYKDCNGAEYLHHPRFTPDIVCIILFRTRTFLVKNNFRNNYKNTNILCPLCQHVDDSQEHLFECPKIKETYDRNVYCEYDDIFSQDTEKLYTVACELKELIEIRERLLNEE
jgi:hypothetical protein